VLEKKLETGQIREKLTLDTSEKHFL